MSGHPTVRADDLEALRQVVKDNRWISRALATNTDRAAMNLLNAAIALLERAEEPQPEVAPPGGPSIDFYVMGLPSPQGSKTVVQAGERHRVIEGSSAAGRAKLQSWRASVVEAAAKAAGGEEPLEGPLALNVTFRLPMPRSRPKWLQGLGEGPSSVKPDLDKLLRGLMDGLKQGGLIRDDAQIASVATRKDEVVGWTGARVSITPISFTRQERADALG